jgi:spore germination protein
MEYKTVRNHDSLTQQEWDELYKDASFDVSVKVRLIRTGVTD